MKRQRISIAHLTPPLGRILSSPGPHSEESEGQMLPALRYAFFGGDILTAKDVRNLRAIAPQVQCVNFYGATETPQAMGFFRAPTEPDSGAADLGRTQTSERIPIGRGIADVDLLILNRKGCLAGVGELGEIYIRTAYLSEGYIGQEALTREKFLSDPFGAGEPARAYRTGDLGRYRPDGNVEYAGRADQQVKVRGYRIELGEIEAAMLKFPGVQKAVAVVKANGQEDNSIAGYFVAENGKAGSVEEMRQFLVELLPAYMIPCGFARLDALPLTPNGKTDFRALPDLDHTRTEQAAFAAPSNATEEKIAAIWRDVLGKKIVGVNDNFFDLGGHSLRAVEVHQRLRSEVGPAVSIVDLFKYPTVRMLARFMKDGNKRNPKDSSKTAARVRSQNRAFHRQREMREQLRVEEVGSQL